MHVFLNFLILMTTRIRLYLRFFLSSLSKVSLHYQRQRRMITFTAMTTTMYNTFHNSIMKYQAKKCSIISHDSNIKKNNHQIIYTAVRYHKNPLV
jgi:hypothetical protein